MDFTIKLLESLKNKDEAKKVVKEVQDAIDDLTIASTEAIKVAKEANELVEAYEKQNAVLQKSNLDMVEVVKNINTVLASKSDLFKGDEDMKVIMDVMAEFILGSSAIKAGVISANA